MFNDRYFLIRYTGGSGGDTFSNILNAKINGTTNLRARDDHNRSTYDDLFNMEFTHPVSNKSTQEALSLPVKEWREINDDQLKAVVEYCKHQEPTRRIGKMHHLFDTRSDYRYVFDGFTVIDLVPPLRSAWIVRALHLFKSALRMKTDDYTRFSRIFGLDKEEKFAEHVRLHGWWPEWYVWRGPLSLEQFLTDELTTYHLHLQSLPPVLDASVNSLELTLDESMPWIDKFKNDTGIDLGDERFREYLRPWIRKNNEIIDFIGLREHLDADYDWETKNRILQTNLISMQHEILKYNKGT